MLMGCTVKSWESGRENGGESAGGGREEPMECWCWDCLGDGHPLGRHRRKTARRGAMAACCHTGAEEERRAPRTEPGGGGRLSEGAREGEAGERREEGQRTDGREGPRPPVRLHHLRSLSHGGGKGQASLGPPARLEEEVSLGDLSSLPQCPLTPKGGASFCICFSTSLPLGAGISLLFFFAFPPSCSSLFPPCTLPSPNPPVT